MNVLRNKEEEEEEQETGNESSYQFFVSNIPKFSLDKDNDDDLTDSKVSSSSSSALDPLTKDEVSDIMKIICSFPLFPKEEDLEDEESVNINVKTEEEKTPEEEGEKVFEEIEGIDSSFLRTFN